MNLTDKEKELIVSCLLHTASVDVCIDLTEDETKQLVKLAKKVSNWRLDENKVTHAYVYGTEGYWDELGVTDKIIKDFNIRQETEEDK